MKKAIFLVIIFFLLSGCAVITYQPDAATIEQIETITPGMTVIQVQQVLGKPYKVSHMYEGKRDEHVFVHQYAVACGVYPFDKHNVESGPLRDDQINEKFKYRLARYMNTDILDRVYYLQFVYEDSILIKYEALPDAH